MADLFSAETRFWARVRKGDGCWEWMGYIHPGRYGGFWVNGKCYTPPRYLWEITNGPIPKGVCVLHRCDNRACVRLSHLYLGTYRDNALDREARGRGRDSRGTKNGRDKLTEADVRFIRKAHAAGTSQAALARQFNVWKTAVNKIVKRRTWKHI